MTVLATLASIYIPEFSTMMAFLGSFSAFILCILGPIAAKVALQGHCGWIDGLLLCIVLSMTVWGTTVAFLDY